MTLSFSPYTRTSTARILNLKADDVLEVNEWIYVIWVRTIHGCKFLSKQAYRRDFLDYRRNGATGIKIEPLSLFSFRAINQSNHRQYTLKAIPGMGYTCTCEDYKRQQASLGKALCKHKIALNDYLETGGSHEVQS